MLMINKNQIVDNKTVANKLDLINYHASHINKDIARDIQLIIKELKKIIKKTKLNDKEMSDMIKVNRSTGYKMIG